MEARPLVSICIPTFNGAKFLTEALDSVKNQTYKNIEVIISDDNSKDETIKIVKTFKKEVSFPVTIHNHQPSGIGANWNNCIKKANGEFIKFLFQDDILYSTCIEEMVKTINAGKNIGLVACKRDLLLEKNITPEIKRWTSLYSDLQEKLRFKNEDVSFLDKKFLKQREFSEYPFNKIGEPTTVLFPKKIVNRVGYFNEEMSQILDYEFYYRILKLKKIAIINNKLVGFRLHPLQTTNVNRTKELDDDEIYDRILIRDFFWYLSSNERKRLFKKYFPISFKVLKSIRKVF